MDWLHQVKDAVERKIFGQVANLLNLETDLLFFDTTSTYFELSGEGEPVPRDKNGNATDDEQKAAEGKPGGFRAYGKSKDHRDNLPQRDCPLSRIVWVPDRGFTSRPAAVRLPPESIAPRPVRFTMRCC